MFRSRELINNFIFSNNQCNYTKTIRIRNSKKRDYFNSSYFWYKKLLIQNWNFCPCQQRNKSTSSSRQPDGLIIMYFSCLRELSCFAFFYRQPLHFSLDALSLNNINKLIETPRYRCCAKYIPQLESFFWLIEIGEVVACVCLQVTSFSLFTWTLLLFTVRNRKEKIFKKFYRGNVLVYWVSCQLRVQLG